MGRPVDEFVAELPRYRTDPVDVQLDTLIQPQPQHQHNQMRSMAG
ncbi:UDP-N-acetylglucosamine 2-epimerase [Pseudomonas savastanoi pv. nerii]|nr:UDP-N-acetylglucosamine 2-epimerase [Pseudomonas savastanoi pv. nerii]RMU46476.1 UDP-N-acetylglucosamine 2-epimerase [Pseudomonas savastanoi pv. nerii]